MTLTVLQAQEMIEPVYGDRRDKLGYPEIDHIMRVAEGVSEIARPMAILHDVIEDGLFTFRQLYPLCDIYQFETLLLITRDGTLTYMNYIRMLRDAQGLPGQLAREIKLSDLTDNMTRPNPSNMQGMRQPGGRYWRAWQTLTGEGPNFLEAS